MWVVLKSWNSWNIKFFLKNPNGVSLDLQISVLVLLNQICSASNKSTLFVHILFFTCSKTLSKNCTDCKVAFFIPTRFSTKTFPVLEGLQFGPEKYKTTRYFFNYLSYNNYHTIFKSIFVCQGVLPKLGQCHFYHRNIYKWEK